MTVIEQSTIGKHGESDNEDGLFVNNAFAVVIDGSTSKADRQLIDGTRNGRLAMLTIKEAMNTMPQTATLNDFCDRLTAAIQDKYHSINVDNLDIVDNPQNRITASVIAYSAHWNQLWMIGDCHCLVNGKHYINDKPYEERLAKRRAEIVKRLLNEGHTVVELQQNDIARAEIVGEIKAATHQQNKLFTVVDGFPILMSGIKTIDVPIGTELILTTDGYPLLCPTLAESENFLQHLIAEDPLMTGRYPATKGVMSGNDSFDDRTFLRIHT